MNEIFFNSVVKDVLSLANSFESHIEKFSLYQTKVKNMEEKLNQLMMDLNNRNSIIKKNEFTLDELILLDDKEDYSKDEKKWVVRMITKLENDIELSKTDYENLVKHFNLRKIINDDFIDKQSINQFEYLAKRNLETRENNVDKVLILKRIYNKFDGFIGG